MLFDEGWYLVREVCGGLWDPSLQQFRQHWQLETYYAQVFYTELHNIIFEPSPRFSTMYFVQKPDLFVSFSRFLGRGGDTFLDILGQLLLLQVDQDFTND